MSDEHQETTETVSPGLESFSEERDLEQEITYSLILNWFIAGPVIFVIFAVLTTLLSKRYLQHEFIDEIFHVSMTQQYYKLDFLTWNPKITTPPGLYYIGFLWSKAISFLHLPVNPIGLTSLRLLNTFGGTIFLPFALNHLFILNPIGFWTSSITLFPVLSTYYTLYYTDVWSTIIIVSSLSVGVALPFGEKRSIQLSALLGLVSVFLRQTNIIWNIFILVVVVERRAIIQKSFTDSFLNNSIKFIIQFFEDFYEISLPYLTNFFLFFCFIVYNRGITLGDKENHVAGLHIAQLFYCFTFITVFSWPIWLSQDLLSDYFRRYRIGPLFIIIELSTIVLFIRFFTVVHPFLLADNRHYTFYIWRKIINLRWYTKYLLSPVYHFSIYVVINGLNTNAFYFNSISEIPFKEQKDLPLKPTGISNLALLGCITLTVVPSPLFEPRYYIIPYIFFRLFTSVAYEPFFNKGSVKGITIRRLHLELLWFILVNLITFAIFILYPFAWTSETQLQRIIW